jgi:hypothetical protein
MTIYCGVRDGDGVSPYYKAWLTQNGITVAGYMTGETAITLAQLWNSPFEGDTAGNAGGMEKVSALAQTASGTTSKTLFNSKMVWEGSEALTVSTPLQFIAYSNAKTEVNDPIQYLLQMSSPELYDKSPLGAIPQKVTLDLGRRLVTNVYISNVTYNENAPKTKDGYFTHNEITLDVTLDGTVNASKVPNLFR